MRFYSDCCDMPMDGAEVDIGICPCCHEHCDAVAEEEEGYDESENDGQPDEYTEWQDLYGGDDYDHGQFDNGDW